MNPHSVGKQENIVNGEHVCVVDGRILLRAGASSLEVGGPQGGEKNMTKAGHI